MCVCVNFKITIYLPIDQSLDCLYLLQYVVFISSYAFRYMHIFSLISLLMSYQSSYIFRQTLLVEGQW